MMNVIPQSGNLTGILVRQGLAMLFFCINLGTAPAAAQQLEALPTLSGALQGVCAADYRWFCDNIPAGDGRVLACFADHGAALSGPCRTALGTHAVKPSTTPQTAQPPAKPRADHTSRFTTFRALS
jgi:hypothetical protein